MMDTSHGNKISKPHKPARSMTVRKVPADSVPYGDSISRNGRTVWVALDDAEAIVAVAATAPEARAKYREVVRARDRERKANR